MPVAVNLTVSDATLLGGGHAPGWIAGYGPVPAGVARDLVATALEQAHATLRRLYTTSAGSLVAMDARSRSVPRRRWGCSSTCATSRAAPRGATHPIRHRDHVIPDAAGGPTSAGNGQGLCEACNQAKEAPGFTALASDDGRTVVTTLPTGHQVRSRAPALPPGDPPVRIDPLHARLQLVLDGYPPAA